MFYSADLEPLRHTRLSDPTWHHGAVQTSSHCTFSRFFFCGFFAFTLLTNWPVNCCLTLYYKIWIKWQDQQERKRGEIKRTGPAYGFYNLWVYFCLSGCFIWKKHINLNKPENVHATSPHPEWTLRHFEDKPYISETNCVTRYLLLEIDRYLNLVWVYVLL